MLWSIVFRTHVPIIRICGQHALNYRRKNYRRMLNDLPKILVCDLSVKCFPEYREVWVTGFPNQQAINLLLQSISSYESKLIGELQGLTLPFDIENITEFSVTNLTIDCEPKSVIEASFVLTCPYAKH
jgi:hypothetical protein